jgi:hypothetical protein
LVSLAGKVKGGIALQLRIDAVAEDKTYIRPIASGYSQDSGKSPQLLSALSA